MVSLDLAPAYFSARHSEQESSLTMAQSLWKIDSMSLPMFIKVIPPVLWECTKTREVLFSLKLVTIMLWVCPLVAAQITPNIQVHLYLY